MSAPEKVRRPCSTRPKSRPAPKPCPARRHVRQGRLRVDAVRRSHKVSFVRRGLAHRSVAGQSISPAHCRGIDASHADEVA